MRPGAALPGKPRLAGVALALLLCLATGGAVAVGPSVATEAAAAPPAWRRQTVAAAHLPEFAGVRLVRVTVSGDGGLLDLRYQVVDPALAAALHNPSTPPALVDERTGLIINELFMGHSHSGELKPAVTYYLVFDNPGHWIHSGGQVTVLLGNAQVEHVTVR